MIWLPSHPDSLLSITSPPLECRVVREHWLCFINQGSNLRMRNSIFVLEIWQCNSHRRQWYKSHLDILAPPEARHPYGIIATISHNYPKAQPVPLKMLTVFWVLCFLVVVVVLRRNSTHLRKNIKFCCLGVPLMAR